MENRFWTVTYRNRDNDQRITAAVFAADQRQAQEKAQDDGRIDDREVWEIESVEPLSRKRWRGFSLLNSARSSRAGILPAPAAGR